MHYSTLLRLLPLALCSFAAPASAVPSAPVSSQVAIIPQPRQLEQTENQPGFLLRDGIRVHYSVSRSEMGRAAIRALMAAGFSVLPEEMEGELTVRLLDAGATAVKGAYELEVTPQGITIGVYSPDADFHTAAQTLAQAVTQDSAGQPALPAMKVSDHPSLQHRGIMLDPCRHPISVEDTKKVLRLMARYKLNRLHWHLCDDQGWRLEILKYPRLTEIASKRTESSDWQNQRIKDGKPVAFFYSQDEVRDMVDYAHSLGITIVPEIEIPGHASAAVAAYPELGKTAL